MPSGYVTARLGLRTFSVGGLFLHAVHAVRSADADHLSSTETEAVVRLPRDARQESEDVLESVAKSVSKQFPI